MLLRWLPFLLILALGSPIPAHSSIPAIPPLKGKTEILRIEEAQAWIQKKLSSIPAAESSKREMELIQILYFLESHLETLKLVAFKCKNQKLELENSIERSLPRGAKAEELSDSHLHALKNLFSTLCPKAAYESSSI